MPYLFRAWNCSTLARRLHFLLWPIFLAGGSFAEGVAGADTPASAEAWTDVLTAQGLSPANVMGYDSHGVPLRCGEASEGSLPEAGGEDSALPVLTRGWETIPCVIRNDGLDTFRLQVSAVGPVSAVTLDVYAPIAAMSGLRTSVLRDNGLSGDEAAGDFVFTSEPLRFDTNFTMAAYLRYDTNGPPGLDFFTVGVVRIREITGATNEFLILPSIGILNRNLPLVRPAILSGDVAVTPHLINVQTTARRTQSQLRFLEANVPTLTARIYDVLPDDFDFLMFLSMDHLELTPRTTGPNFNAGIHYSVQVNFSGTGKAEFDSSALYGSAGRLLGICILDTAERGVYSQNATHELTHQWSSFTNPSLGLAEGDAHYRSRSSAASLVGGVEFVPNAAGYLLNCAEGRSMAHHAPPIDLYMMGLIDGSEVPPLRVYSSSLQPPFAICGQTISNIETTVTIEDIQRLHGVRTPGPGSAQREFNIGFVAESHARFLNPVEMTFYETIAAWYTRDLPPGQPVPSQSFNWVPVTGYFGHGSTWRSHIPSLIMPALVAADRSADGTVIVRGKGLPEQLYALETSTTLTNWTLVATQRADGTGGLRFEDRTPSNPARFYRLVWQEQ